MRTNQGSNNLRVHQNPSPALKKHEHHHAKHQLVQFPQTLSLRENKKNKYQYTFYDREIKHQKIQN